MAEQYPVPAQSGCGGANPTETGIAARRETLLCLHDALAPAIATPRGGPPQSENEAPGPCPQFFPPGTCLQTPPKPPIHAFADGPVAQR
jgi:hypothetical protein